ncbi:winged helix-turn-helix transcriptional regulator [Bordetella genomosp. 1]|uniref:Transcriptional regulator n=1 Tax=Bordetella genomosp. 1 TaxID=1395607 RepID=A0ABX4F2W4_9BORD|nr:winged helix-turn-helix transcriptional regulator [Bordetella genomosp. 1]OZI65389.1 transcriptional regulator [Bordetella genomosp. 1]
MAGKRSYDDGCASAHALELIGERWALLIVRELLLGPKRFTDLRIGLPAISPNVLTQRLTELEAGAVLRRRKLPPPAGAWVYELTEWGQQLEPIVLGLGAWGARSPQLPQALPLSDDALALSWRAMADPNALGGPPLRLQIEMAQGRYAVEVRDGRFAIARGTHADAQATVRASTEVLAALTYAGADLDAVLRAGQAQLTGERAALARFVGLFTLPAPAPAARPGP